MNATLLMTARLDVAQHPCQMANGLCSHLGRMIADIDPQQRYQHRERPHTLQPLPINLLHLHRRRRTTPKP